MRRFYEDLDRMIWVLKPHLSLKLLSEFHAAKPNRSRVKQKSEISHSLVGKWPSKNKKTRDASVGHCNYAVALRRT